MTGILKFLLLKLFRRAIPPTARETIRGKEGSMARVMLVFPLFLLALFGYMVWLASSGAVDPEKVPERSDIIVAWAVGILVPLGLLLMSLHFLTFRVWLSDGFLNSSGLLGGMKSIDLSRPFTFHYDEEQDFFKIIQNGTKIKLVWTVEGYDEFLDLVYAAHNRL